MAKELYVGHLSEETTEEDLRKLFSVMGVVTSVHLIRDTDTGEFKRCGYVRMLSSVDLKEVVETLDGAYLVDREIVVSIAVPQKDRPARKTGSYKPWMKDAPKPAKVGAKPGQKGAASREKAKSPATATERPKSSASRSQQSKTGASGTASAAPARGKRPGSGGRPPRAGR